ncbi:MAG: TolC family protein [Deltaproteobacteria bacterium]|nr:TolC family protein [Deltaproteobacteria bacterium]
MNKLAILILLFGTCQNGHALRKSRFEELMVPVDIYSVPKDAKRLLSKRELFTSIAKQGLPIKMARQDYESEKDRFQLVYDSYWPKPMVSTSYTSSRTNSYGIPTYSKAFTFGVSIAGNTTWGLNYGFDLPKITDGTSLTQDITTPTGTVSMGLNATLSLLKGSVFFQGRIPKTKADIDLELSKIQLRSTVQTTLLQGEQAFYDVLQKQVQAKVREQALKSSRALSADIKDMIAAGEADKLSAVKTELQVAQDETELLAAQNDLATARQALMDIMAVRSNELPFYPDPNSIKDVPKPPQISVQQALDLAKRQRPDYLSAQLRHKKAELDVQSAYSNVLPKVDLKTAYGFVATDDAFGRAFSTATQLKDPQYSVGVEMSYSFGNDSDKSSYRLSKISFFRSELSLEQLNNQITKEVSNSLQSADFSFRKLRTSELAKELSEKKLHAEFEKFRVGESNIRNILDFQTELNNTRITELNARIELLRNLAILRNSLGDFPDGVTVRND